MAESTPAPVTARATAFAVGAAAGLAVAAALALGLTLAARAAAGDRRRSGKGEMYGAEEGGGRGRRGEGVPMAAPSMPLVALRSSPGPSPRRRSRAAATPPFPSLDGDADWPGRYGAARPRPPRDPALRGLSPPPTAASASASDADAVLAPRGRGSGALPPPAPAAASHVPRPWPPPGAPPLPTPPPTHAVATAGEAAAEGRIIEDAALHEQYCRVITPEPAASEEAEGVCGLLRECLDLRLKWSFVPAAHPGATPVDEAVKPSDVPGPRPFEWAEGDPGEPGPSPLTAAMVDGVMHVTDPASGERLFAPPGAANDFFSDMHRVLKIAATGPVKTLAHHRLTLLEQKFNLHVMLNADKEFLAQKSEEGRGGAGRGERFRGPRAATPHHTPPPPSRRRAAPRLLQRAQSRHPRPPLGVHAPEAPPEVY